MGESVIAERILDWENKLPKDIKLAYLPNLGKVRLRLSSKGYDETLLLKRVNEQIDALIPFIEDIFVGFEGQTSLEIQLQEGFISQGKTLAIAESCTGGLIASRLTKIPGSSRYFKGALVAYHTHSKVNILEVSEALIDTYSVVSKDVVASMAEQVRKKFNTTMGVATTGNAGPSKGDSQAEIGTVYIAISTEKEIFVEQFLFGIHRERVMEKAVNKALEMIYKQLG